MNTEKILLAAFSAYITKTVCSCDSVTDENFDPFMKKAAQHKILPMVCSKLITDKKTELSDENMQRMRSAVRGAAAAQTLKSYAFTKLYQQLIEGGVRPLCVKGAVCRKLYPEPDLRASGDEDLIVSDKDYSLCRQLLINYGYLPEKTSENADENVYETGFYNEKNGMRIELHRRLFAPDSALFCSFNDVLGDMFEDYSSVNINGVEVFCPSPDKHLLYLVLHALKHFVHAGVGIRQVCDIALTARSFSFDCAQLFGKCAEVNAEIFLSAVFLICRDYFGLPQDTFAGDMSIAGANISAENLLNDILSGALYGADTLDRQHSSTITLFSLEAQSKGEKSTLLSSVFPSAKKISDRYPYLQKHPFLLPLAWAQRIFKFSKSKTNSQEVIKTGERRVALMKEYGILKDK